VSEVASAKREQGLAADLVMLTKPRIISLLLVTTAAPMYIAGSPSWLTVLLVMIGGYLMAGGANAVNMYIDQDIDDRMARTRTRPIPGGRMTPRAVLAFGLALAVAATWLLANYVNVLTSALALAGFYFYVFIYTRWLKRTTPQNIVIGGAAGAFPPLVGWAATTGSIDLTALYLFLIVFYWTPPHFWALSLRIRKDYAAAGIPMLPVVKGIPETTRQIALYTVLMVAISLVLWAVARMGPVYLVAAVVLGAVFLWQAYRLWRHGTSEEASTAGAIRLYRYSISYLTLLFAAVAVDALVLSAV
jgi:protoheme IX farnesyltransferase